MRARPYVLTPLHTTGHRRTVKPDSVDFTCSLALIKPHKRCAASALICLPALTVQAAPGLNQTLSDSLTPV